MPSPFPGMDPYLEDPGGWVTFHNRLIGTLDELLSERLGPDYFVAQQTAVYLIDTQGERHQPPIGPDVYVADPPAGLLVPVGQAITPPTLVLARYPERIEQRFLEIRDSRQRRVIAVIEVLSPTNKDGDGARQFDRKRRATMTTPVHWVEIDLLRAGTRFPPAAGASDYCVVLKRGDRPLGEEATEFLIWYVDLRDPLPTIAVPLTPTVPAVTIELPAVLALVFARFYEGRLDYAGSPPPPALRREGRPVGSGAGPTLAGCLRGRRGGPVAGRCRCVDRSPGMVGGLMGSSKVGRGYGANLRAIERRARSTIASRCPRSRRMGSRSLSLQLSADVRAAIKETGERTGRDIASVAGEILTEGVKMRRFPGIVFVDGPPGRTARLAGAATDVRDVIRTYNRVGRDRKRLCQAYPRLDKQQLDLALAYWRAYPREIAAQLEADLRRAIEAVWEKHPITRPARPSCALTWTSTLRIADLQAEVDTHGSLQRAVRGR